MKTLLNNLGLPFDADFNTLLDEENTLISTKVYIQLLDNYSLGPKTSLSLVDNNEYFFCSLF